MLSTNYHASSTSANPRKTRTRPTTFRILRILLVVPTRLSFCEGYGAQRTNENSDGLRLTFNPPLLFFALLLCCYRLIIALLCCHCLVIALSTFSHTLEFVEYAHNKFCRHKTNPERNKFHDTRKYHELAFQCFINRIFCHRFAICSTD